MGFEPMNNGFADRRLRPLSHRTIKKSATNDMELQLIKKPRGHSPTEHRHCEVILLNLFMQNHVGQQEQHYIRWFC